MFWIYLCKFFPTCWPGVWVTKALSKFSIILHLFSKNDSIASQVDSSVIDKSSPHFSRVLWSSFRVTMWIKSPSKIYCVLARVRIARRCEIMQSLSSRRPFEDPFSTPFKPNIAWTCAWKYKTLLSSRLTSKFIAFL